MAHFPAGLEVNAAPGDPVKSDNICGPSGAPGVEAEKFGAAAREAHFLGKRGPDGPPPTEDIEKLERFREVLEREKRRPHRLADLAVDGSDLIELGFRPGPELGATLRDLLHDVDESPARNTRDGLLRRARAKLPS